MAAGNGIAILAKAGGFKFSEYLVDVEKSPAGFCRVVAIDDGVYETGADEAQGRGNVFTGTGVEQDTATPDPLEVGWRRRRWWMRRINKSFFRLWKCGWQMDRLMVHGKNDRWLWVIFVIQVSNSHVIGGFRYWRIGIAWSGFQRLEMTELIGIC